MNSGMNRRTIYTDRFPGGNKRKVTSSKEAMKQPYMRKDFVPPIFWEREIYSEQSRDYFRTVWS